MRTADLLSGPPLRRTGALQLFPKASSHMPPVLNPPIPYTCTTAHRNLIAPSESLIALKTFTYVPREQGYANPTRQVLRACQREKDLGIRAAHASAAVVNAPPVA